MFCEKVKDKFRYLRDCRVPEDVALVGRFSVFLHGLRPDQRKMSRDLLGQSVNNEIWQPAIEYTCC